MHKVYRNILNITPSIALEFSFSLNADGICPSELSSQLFISNRMCAETATVPTSAPITAAPTSAPITSAPTSAPITPVPTSAPVTAAPTSAPITTGPTSTPSTAAPTSASITCGFSCT
eukprot:240802_1